MNKKMNALVLVGIGSFATGAGMWYANAMVREFRGMPDIQIASVLCGGGLSYLGGAFVISGVRVLKGALSK